MNQLHDYVSKKYKILNANLGISGYEIANESCFRLLEVEDKASGNKLSFFLSPDGNFLVPRMYDIRVDPIAEEIKERKLVDESLQAGKSPKAGPPSAPVRIVEFSDFECPYCQRFATVLAQEALLDQQTKVQLTFKNYPLPMHPWARSAAEAAECVANQNSEAFWKIHDYIFAHQKELTKENVVGKISDHLDGTTGINQKQFEACVSNNEAQTLVQNDINMGKANGVSATPTFFINGVKYSGYKSASELRQLIEKAAELSPAH